VKRTLRQVGQVSRFRAGSRLFHSESGRDAVDHVIIIGRMGISQQLSERQDVSACKLRNQGGSLPSAPCTIAKVVSEDDTAEFPSRLAGSNEVRPAERVEPDRLQPGEPVAAAGPALRDARYCWLLLAASHLTRRLFGAMLQRIAALSRFAGPAG
jgi:hypothetical protein